MTNTQKKVSPFQVLLILFFIACIFCTISFSREMIISLMEALIGRKLQEMTKWNAVITGSMSFFAYCAAVLYYFMYIPLGKKVWISAKDKILSLIKTENFFKHLLTLFLIIFVSYFAIIRADYDFFDDMKRIISGHKSWVGASRYVSEALSVFLHTNFYLNDISPLSQIIAMLVLAVSAYVLAYSASDGKITILILIASVLFAICPFYIENISFKFDSPYMALAMFFAILPFTFKDDEKTYASVSIISLIFMMTSYQAGNSVYIVLAIFFTLKALLNGDDFKSAIRFAVLSIICYAASLIIFRLFIMIPTASTISERDTSLENVKLSGLILSNLKNYLKTVFTEYGNIWSKLFTLILAVIFPFAGGLKAAQNKKESTRVLQGFIQGFLLSLFALVLMLLLSFGAYLIIGNTLINHRAFMGFDILISVLALFALLFTKEKSKLRLAAAITTVCLCYGFMVQATVAGNLYSKQKKYEEFRYSILLQDLSQIINPTEKNHILLDGDIGYATKTHMEQDNYHFVPLDSVTSGWAKYILQDWNMDLDYLQIEASSTRIARNPEFVKLKESLPVIKDTYYHKICGSENTYYVFLKNPRVEEYE